MKRSFRNQLKKVSTGFLCIWLSGVIFLLCCDSASAATDSCPLVKVASSPHCFKSEPAFRFQTIYADCMEECGILSALFSGSRKADHFPVLDLVASRTEQLPKVSRIATDTIRRTVVERQPSLSRQKTYLLNLNFRN